MTEQTQENRETGEQTQQQTGQAEGGKVENQQGGQPNTSGTIAETGQTEGQKTSPQTWPDDWRDRLSKGDEKRSNLFKRYTSVEALGDALWNANEKIRSGQLKSTLPDNATEEQVKAYRAENGIPETPEGYFENMPDGIILGEEDRALAGDFVKALHGKNASPEMVHEALKWYTGFAERQQAAQVESDKSNWAETEESLRSEWGQEYRANVNAITGLLDMLPGGQETRDLILTARGADGRKLGGNMEVLRGLAQIAHMVNPAGTVVPGAPSNAGKTIQDELNSIAKTRRENPDAYWRDQKMQDRELELTRAKERLEGKAA